MSQTHLRRRGQITFLRVHDEGTGFGGPGNVIDVEAVAQIDSESDHFFGLTLREGDRLPSHQGMLALLRDGLIHDHLETTVEYELDDRPSNGIVFRVELRRR